MSRRLLRALAVIVFLTGAATGTAGCYTARPAIAYLSAVTVDVSAFSGVAAIQFLSGGEVLAGAW